VKDESAPSGTNNRADMILIFFDQGKHAVLINIKAAKHHDLRWQKAMLSCKH
jgi:hypothetical protein